MKLKNGKKKRRKDFVYKVNKYKYDFQQYETTMFLGDNGKSVYNVKTSIDEAEINQSRLLNCEKNFKDRSRPKAAEVYNKERNT